MKTGFTLTVLLASGLGLGAVWAHSGATGIVKERMDAMTEIGDSVKSVGQMLKGEAPYNRERIAAAGQAIAGHAGQALTDLFPEGSLHAPSEASPEIWADWAEFSKIAGTLKESAVALSDLAEAGAGEKDIAAAFGNVAGTCKACHEAFRIKK